MMEFLNKENPLCFKSEQAGKLSRGLFWLTYTLYLLFQTSYYSSYRYVNSDWKSLMVTCVWVCFFLALLNIVFLCRFTIWQDLLILLFVLFYLYLWHHTHHAAYTFLQSMIIVVSSREVLPERTIRFSFVTRIPLILIPILLEVSGFLPERTYARSGVERYALGFTQPNTLGMMCVSLVLLWLLLRYQRLKVYDYLAWLLIALFVWMVPNSRTATFLILILCVLSLLFRRWGDKLLNCRLVRYLCTGVFWIMMAGSVAGAYFYDAASELYVMIDRTLFTTRLSLAHTFLGSYEVKLFGQKVNTLSPGTNTKSSGALALDNFYVYQLLACGVISTIILLSIFTWLMYKAIRANDQAAVIGLLIVAVYSVYERMGTVLLFNVMLLQAGQIFTCGEAETETKVRQNE